MKKTTSFHVHMISDATGETLLTVARAAAAQYQNMVAIEHIHAMVRSENRLSRIFSDLEHRPGIVLYTLLNDDLSNRLEQFCRSNNLPCVSILDPVLDVFQSYLGAEQTYRVGAQHALNAEYFRRMDALNFTMAHDDGQHADDLDEADVILVGISRTSKTPTCIYLANRGVRAANVPLVMGIEPPAALKNATKPLITGLIASVERVTQVRRNRLEHIGEMSDSSYIDRISVREEIAYAKRLCTRYQWPIIDVTRRSVEETAAEIISSLNRANRLRNS